MKSSISNIAWGFESDVEMYHFLKNQGVSGLEIAPTRIFPENPYEHLKDAAEFKKRMYEQYGLQISSMQSIWFGRTESIFGDALQRESLYEYTKKAFAFSHALDCGNLVFGCPRNRNINKPEDIEVAIEFFSQLGELAVKEDTVLALEANPPIYNTNFMNTTSQAFDIVQQVNSQGIAINYDLGTVIENEEEIEELKVFLPKVNHIHISEPYLAEVSYREIHAKLIQLLQEQNYTGYVSIEMKNLEDISKVKNAVIGLQKRLGESYEIG